jgi:hypothetical protein
MDDIQTCLGVIVPQVPRVNITVNRNRYDGFGSSLHLFNDSKVCCPDCGSEQQISKADLDNVNVVISQYPGSYGSALRSMNHDDMVRMFMHRKIYDKTVHIPDKLLVAGIILNALSLRLDILEFKKKNGCKCNPEDYSQLVINGVYNLLMTYRFETEALDNHDNQKENMWARTITTLSPTLASAAVEHMKRLILASNPMDGHSYAEQCLGSWPSTTT